MNPTAAGPVHQEERESHVTMPPSEGEASSAQGIAMGSSASASGGHTDIRVKGRAFSVRSARIEGRTVVVTGTWLRMAAVYDEEFVEGEPVPDPEAFLAALTRSRLSADIFTFAQKLPDVTPRYGYYREWDNPAVIPITTFSNWWDHQVESSVRRAVRKATKVGVVVEPAELNEAFVKGIVDIYGETPVRQGKAFWHYQKDAEAVRTENATYPERSAFLGAYHKDELVGFLKIIYVDKTASIVQILSKMKHFDKRPTNALIAKAVELCEQKGLSHLVYCSYVYNDPNSSLTEFKRRNGFEQLRLPRYYVPVTLKGRIALKLALHRGLARHIPTALLVKLLKMRSLWYSRRSPITKATA